jgi:site-specific DNA-methyltransferase (adenine-specific)
MGVYTHTIYNEDCLKTMNRMPDACIDLIVTSPPYDDLRKYEGFSFDFEAVAKEMYRVLKNGGVCVWVVGDSVKNGGETLTSFRQALYFVDEVGFKMHDTMVYYREGMPLNHRRYEQHFEYMFVMSKGVPKTFNPIKVPTKHQGREVRKTTTRKKAEPNSIGDNMGNYKVGKKKIASNVWAYGVGLYGSTHDKDAFQHPAIFPERLAHDHIISWSNKDEVVYDPFGGSGTVAKVCELTGRAWIMSEISKKYCKIAEERIAKYESHTS